MIHRALRDFMVAIRPELVDLETPEADDRLLVRIMASRQGGTRVILPHADPPPESRRVFYAMAIAAGIATAALAVRGLAPKHSTDRPWSSTDSWFGGELVYAQAAPVPVFAPPLALVPDRLRPLEIQYRVTRSAPGEPLHSSELGITVDRAPGPTNGASAWRVVSVTRDVAIGQRVTIDTAYLAAGDLRPLANAIHESPYRRYQRIDVRQRFEDTRLVAEMTAQREDRIAARRTVDRRLDLGAGPYVAEPFAPLALVGVPLSPGRAGIFSILGWAIRDDDVFRRLNLRVEGQEQIRVPAGEFACWRIAVTGTGRRSIYWVRRSDGLGVRSLQSSDGQGTGVRELVLTGENRVPR